MLRMAVIMLFFSLWGSGCSGGEEPATVEEERVRLESFAFRELPGGARILTGVLYNPTDRPIANAQIQVSLYDAANRQVGSMIVPVHDIEPGEQQVFREAVDSEQDVRGARPRSVLVQ